MFLKTLELQGFKSFPDKTVLNFGKGITSVVGPNGSGKSNISDAVRWVLGEQSTKSLRGTKMEDVIFSGTDTRKAIGYAEVTLRLDNKDRSLEKHDRDEVTVTRRYYRSSESEYLLNGETVRLKDIHELFMDTGLGRDGYSLVGQGKVADLINSKSSQRREMLEEAAGISHFRYRRSDANKKLDQAEENLVRLRDILAEIEGRIGPLKTQSEKAKKFLELSAAKRDIEIGLWLNTIKKSRKLLSEHEDRFTVANVQFNAAERSLNEIENEIDEMINTGRDITLQIEAIRQSAAALEEEAAGIDSVIAVEKNNVLHKNEAIDRIKKDRLQASDTEKHISEQIEQNTADIEELFKEIAGRKAELEAAVLGISGLRLESDEFSVKSSELNSQISAYNSEISETRIKASAVATSIEEMKLRTENIDGVLLSKSSVEDELREQRRLEKAELLEASEEAQELENSMSGYEIRVESRRSKTEKMKKEIDALNLEIHQKQARMKMLDDLEKNLEGYSGSVKAVIKESNRGTLRGIHGTITQLVSVENKYTVAVETALGAAVQNIVTDTENDAKRAIEYLKEAHAGRATFLPISAIKHKPFTETGLQKCDGFIDMADKLLSYDKQYDEIIKNLLARTAVSEDIDSAIAIAKKYSYRFRVVTLDGQTVNAGGSMTGGSRGQGSVILGRANEINKISEQTAVLQKQLEAYQTDYKALMQELAAAEADFGGASADLTRAQESVIRKESALKLTEERLLSVSGTLDDLKAEKRKLIERIDEANEQSAKYGDEIKNLNLRLDGLSLKTEKLNDEFLAINTKREELSHLENGINLKIFAAEKDVQSKEDVIAQLRRRRVSHEENVGKLTEEVAAIEKEIKEKEESIEAMEREAAELREKSKSAKSEIEEQVKRRNESEARITELRSKEKAENIEKEKLSGEIARLEERKISATQDIEETFNKLYDEYQLSIREAEELDIVIEEPAKAQRELNEFRAKIRALGNVNVGAVEEYKEVSERYEFLKTQIGDAEKSREELMKIIQELTEDMSKQFREQFNRINSYFKDTFAELFNGGNAEMVLENPADVLECPIEIRVQPPGKNIKVIDLLSGGEKGLSAIALLFAILKVNPAPFCIFDEVEAALDDVNVTRYAKYVRRMSRNTQFILITHRRGTMEEADILYGVTMQEVGVSKLLELKTAEMAKKIGLMDK